MVNTDLLERTMLHILDKPGEWLQSSWRCESGMCFAGWAATLAGGQWLLTPDQVAQWEHTRLLELEQDPACFQRSQLDEKTIAQAVAAYGYRVNKASTNDPERRIQAVEQLLSQQIDGGAGFLIDASCSHIIDTLTWGHRYKRSPSGVPSTTADKTHHSHMGDAVQYLALRFASPRDDWAAMTKKRAVVRSTYRYV